jgi:hypothetical protein
MVWLPYVGKIPINSPCEILFSACTFMRYCDRGGSRNHAGALENRIPRREEEQLRITNMRERERAAAAGESEAETTEADQLHGEGCVGPLG